MASKWSVSTKRNKPAVKNKSRPPARINGARGRLRAFSCLFLNAWGFESPYGVKWAMRISQTAVFGASDPYFRKSNFSVPNPPVFSSECKNTALSCGVFAVHLFYQHNLEVPPRFELGSGAFAELCLTTWLWHRTEQKRSRKIGASDEARTRYLHLGKVALYQMSYTCISDPILCRKGRDDAWV